MNIIYLNSLIASIALVLFIGFYIWSLFPVKKSNPIIPAPALLNPTQTLNLTAILEKRIEYLRNLPI